MEKKQAILIVDDQIENIELLAAYLYPEDYEIVKAYSGEEAIRTLAQTKIDMILLDVRMPGMDGFAVTAKIRKEESNFHLPIILVTSLKDNKDRIRGIEVGCDGFVTKPVDKMELLARVHSLLKLKAYNDLMGDYRKELELEVGKRNEELRNLAGHLQHVREEERRLVAREIHDELGQVLAALKMDLHWVERNLSQGVTLVTEKIHSIVEIADQTIQMVHRIAAELRPGILDDLGLEAAIEWLGTDFSRKNGIPCTVDFTVPKSIIGTKSSTVLFRIVQEALCNVARHAHASKVSVELWDEDLVLNVRVQDDGIGVTEEQSKSPAAFGLIGVRERVMGMLGEMSITGRPGKGTIFAVRIPFPAEGGWA